jgi:hypothetical protein
MRTNLSFAFFVRSFFFALLLSLTVLLGVGASIDMICSYFGVKIALYFAWLGYYTTALLLPGIAGLAYWVIA